MDMKVLVYSNFRNFFLKKMKSLSSMRNGRFYISKFRGKVQKMGVLYTIFLKMLGPSPNFLIIPKIKLKFLEKGEVAGRIALSLLDCKL
jgi:hypothetical protein